MKFYISATGIKRVTISSNSGSAGKESSSPTASTIPSRRILSNRMVLPVVLLLAILLPFLFVRVAFLVLESATLCSSSLDCISGRFFSGNDGALLREELTRALLEVKEGKVNDQGLQGPLESFDELVEEMTSKRHDLRAFAFRTKAMLSKMELKVHSARQRELIYWHLASHGVPKSLHCLCLKLADEYAVNAIARSRLPLPQYVSRLADPSFHHVVLLTDNVLAASVVVSSTIKSSASPEKLVFHIVTDKKTYTSMHAWFALDTVNSAVVEVKGLHQYEWSQKVNSGVKEMIDINRLIWRHHYDNLNEKDLEQGADRKKLDAFTPSTLSLLNQLRIYIPELFPGLNKVVFLDDDLIVQHDLSSLWELDLDGKVVGAVVDSWCGDECCPGRRYRNYLNFSNPIISSNFYSDQCAWLYGMNVLDLEAWRRSNITAKYLEWLKINQNSGLVLWNPGVLPPALIAFKDNVHPLDPLWHLAGLGYRFLEIGEEALESAAVLHFSGPAKPWLGIGSTEVRRLWYKHVNFSNGFIRKCRIMA